MNIFEDILKQLRPKHTHLTLREFEELKRTNPHCIKSVKFKSGQNGKVIEVEGYVVERLHFDFDDCTLANKITQFDCINMVFDSPNEAIHFITEGGEYSTHSFYEFFDIHKIKNRCEI